MKKKVIRVSTVPVSLYLLLEGQLKFLNQEFEVIGVSSPGEYLEKTRGREGIKVFPIEIKRAISPLNDLISLYRLYKFFKKEKPFIVHSITPKAGLLSMIAAYLSGTPHRLHTFTGLIFPSKTGFTKKILIYMDKLLCKCATNIYPEGKGVKQDLLNYNITNRPLNIIANGNVNGVDTDFFSDEHLNYQDIISLKHQYNIQTDDFVYVFVGRLVRDKGIHELVNAFANLDRKGIKLLLVGNFEPDIDPLDRNILHEIENNSNIISVGFQSDIRPFLQMSDIFVFPSYREGFPNVVLQACAMRLPCIVTDINGSNEIIENKVNGLIIKPKLLFELQEKMEEAVSGRHDLKLMGKHAREKIVNSYTREFVWKQLLHEYKNLQ
ncbi:MAG TPA: glycosyltransferase family 4 protein [Mucilaginibacter sp.]|nr:glycosyltransferase family 4 protein [Mucilaginibacter sp.]